jgi:endonuclease/exonuclease/phosphatase family metal-dependent hydrolase
MRPRTRSRIRPALAVAALVGLHALGRAHVRDAFGCGPVDGPDGSDAALVLSTWNLRNFPEPGQDTARIGERVDAIAPHVLAVQEIRDGDALAQLLPARTIHLSEHGGARGQRLGLALDERSSLVEAPLEHRALELGGRLRPAFSAHVRLDSGLDFHVVVVHLKATPEGAATRRVQWTLLADAIARVIASSDDRDLVVLGDFNATGDAQTSAADERRALADVLAKLGLRELPIAGGCSAYWDGARHDGWQEPALLDLVFVAGFADASWSAVPLGPCAAHGCSALRSTTAHPDRDLGDTSDHCGVLVQMRR